MDIRGTATQALSEGIKQAIGLTKKYYLAFAIPVALGFIWGIVSRAYLYGGVMALMSSAMMRSPDTGMMINFGHIIVMLILSMLISIALWMVTFTGAGLILKHRNEDFKLDFSEVLAYAGNRLGSLITGGFLYIFLPSLPVLIPFIGFFYIIGFIVYIFLIGKNYGGFFFWAYPVLAEGKSATEGFNIAKQAVLPQKGAFWTALVLGFIVMWIADLFLAFLPYIGYLLIWTINLIFLLFTGLMYYDYRGDTGQQTTIPTPRNNQSN